MYHKILEKYKEAFPGFPDKRRPRVGAVIREMRINKGIKQGDLSKITGLNKRTISAFENDHQKATSIENLEKYAQILSTSIEDLITLGREYDPCNAFILKRHDAPETEIETEIEGTKERKHETKDWFKSVRLRFNDFDLIPISPPICFRKDLFIARLILPPKRRTPAFTTGMNCSVIGTVSSGFDIRVDYAGESFKLGGAHAFRLNGLHSHSIINDNDDHTAILYLIAKIPLKQIEKKFSGELKPSNRINIAKAVEVLRSEVSQIPDFPLSLRRTACLTDTLNEKQLQEIMRLKKNSSVVYWEKIEDLLGAANASMEDFLLWGRGAKRKDFSVSSSINQPSIVFGACGVEVITRTPYSQNKDFFCGYFEIKGTGKGPQKRTFSDWYRKENTITSLYVENGSVRLVVGNRKRVFSLNEGDSAYIDASFGYSIRNPEDKDARLFFVTSPSFQI